MSDNLKIKVSIADRVYPLTIRRYEEENVRAAAKKIEATLKKYEESYAVKDKQDLLAMCALQLASQVEKSRSDKQEVEETLSGKLNDVENTLLNALR